MIIESNRIIIGIHTPFIDSIDDLNNSNKAVKKTKEGDEETTIGE